MSKFQNILLLVFFALITSSAYAQRSPGVTAGSLDSRTLTVQRKVEDLFERGEFKRAHFIYRNELVPIGDKYAQYMVGYMHLTGMGVDEDAVVASAWYRLASERGTPEFVNVRDQLMHELRNEDRRRSDALYLELRRQFSDLVVLLAFIKRDLRELREPATGSRLSADSAAPVTVLEIRSPDRMLSASDRQSRIRRRLAERLNILLELGDFPDIESDPTQIDIDDIERLVNARIESIPD